MDFRKDDVFRLNLYTVRDGKFVELSPAECVDRGELADEGLLTLAITSTIPPFEDQPTQTERLSGAESEELIIDAGRTRRLLVIGVFGLVLAAGVPLMILLGWQFTMQFFKDNWLILPIGLVVSVAFAWAGMHLAFRGAVPSRLEVRGSSEDRKLTLVSPSDYFRRPGVNRRAFSPAFFFVTRIGIPKAEQSSVEEVTLAGSSSLDAKSYVAGICAQDRHWFSLCKSDDVTACQERVREVVWEIPALASVPVLDLVDESRLVWCGDEPDGSGAMYRKLNWIQKR